MWEELTVEKYWPFFLFVSLPLFPYNLFQTVEKLQCYLLFPWVVCQNFICFRPHTDMIVTEENKYHL